MQERILVLVEEKLTQVLREVDASTQEKAREAWKGINPSPSCNSVQIVMKEIHQALAHGCRERGRVAKEVLLDTLTPIRSELTSKLLGKIMAGVTKAFPENTFVALAEQTRDVYARSLAPQNRFDEKTYALEFALISVSVANISRQSVDSIRISLNELLLQKNVATPPLWKRILKTFFTSAVTWIFGIVSGVVIAVIVYVLGVN